jgi:hypothetical protein
MENLLTGLGIMFILLGLAVGGTLLSDGWPSFITHNHYHNEKEEDEDGE